MPASTIMMLKQYSFFFHFEISCRLSHRFSRQPSCLSQYDVLVSVPILSHHSIHRCVTSPDSRTTPSPSHNIDNHLRPPAFPYCFVSPPSHRCFFLAGPARLTCRSIRIADSRQYFGTRRTVGHGWEDASVSDSSSKTQRRIDRH